MFLDAYDLPKLNNEDRPIKSNQTESVIKLLPTKKTQWLDSFTAKFYQKFKQKQMPILLQLFHIIDREGTFPNSFFEVSITLLSKPEKGIPPTKTID